jgi:cyanobactin maturation PatA/PatG family protease
LRGATPCDETVAGDCRPYLVGKLDASRSLGLLVSEVDAVEPSQAAASLPAHGEEETPTLSEVSRDGGPDVAPQAAELTADVTSINPCGTDESGLIEAEATETQSAPLFSFSGFEERPANEPARRPVRAVATRVLLSVGIRDREGKNMLSETIDDEGGQTNGNVAEATAPTGIKPSGAAMRESTPNRPPGGVKPSGGCGCTGECSCGAGDGAARPQLVFALGELGYDLVSEARKDSLWQAVGGDPYEWGRFATHLGSAPWDAEAVTWTLRVDATPIYAIHPMGPYAPEAYKQLADWLIGQTDSRKIERISLPGWIAGSTTLMSGMTVPVVVPSLRGMYAWDTKSLVASLTASPDETTQLTNFLERVYYELRNLGQSPQERAKNFAATNAYQAQQVFQEAVGAKTELDTISVEKSPICRPDSDCWDVTLTFFDPLNDRAARKVHRFTVDVSDVVPCTVGRTRNWFVR